MSPCDGVQIHLDVTRKKDVYFAYVQFQSEAACSASEILSLSGFWRMWVRHFPNVVVRRHKTIGSKCHVCEDLEVRICTAIMC